MAEHVIKRSRYNGVRDIHVAIVTENTESAYTTAVPVKLARAIKAKVSHKFSSEELESDDGIEDTMSAYEGTEVELEVNTLAPQDYALLYGHKYENGYLVKSAEDEPPTLALGYRERKMNGKYDFIWLYCGKFANGYDKTRETKTRKPATQTETVKGFFHEREIDKKYEISVDEDNLQAQDIGATAAIKNWFAKVQEEETKE